MDLGGALVARSQAAEVVQVREAALDDPALTAEARAVLGPAPCDHGFDAAGPQQPAVLVVVVAAVGDDDVGLPARPAGLAGDRPGVQVVQQRDQLGDVVAVAARDREGERDPRLVDEEVVLGAGTAPVDRARARFGAPFFACT